MNKSILLSLFRGYTDQHPQPVSLEELAQLLRGDASIQEFTDKHRYALSVGNALEAKFYKQKMPCCSVAVGFEGGKQLAHIHHWTGLSLVDVDGIEALRLADLRHRAEADPHTVLTYPTISGCGLRIFYRYALQEGVTKVTQALYKQAFLQGNEYYCRLLGLDATDQQCKNATRLSTLAHCPDLYFNPQAEAIAIRPAQSRHVGRPPKGHHLQEVEELVLKTLEQQGVRYEEGKHNLYISRAGYLLNRYGVPQQEAEAWATERFADYAAQNDVPAIIRSCYTATGEHNTLSLTHRDNWATVKDIQEYLTRKEVRIRHNVITRKREQMEADTGCWTELTDLDVNTLFCQFSNDCGKHLRLGDLQIVIESKFFPQYHPFGAYLEGLPLWDGHTDYIDELASTVTVTGCPQERHNRFFKKWLVAMVAAWLDDEVVNHEILTYIGRQGIYKSTFMNALLPPELAGYVSLKNFSQRLTKDDRLELTEMGLVCLEELDQMKPSEVNQLKAVVTETHINERAAFARYKEQRNHIASFCGTGNNPQFLSDPTGNRRWLPFMVERIVSPKDCPFHYTGIYSQAYALYKQGFHYWFDDAENAEIEEHNTCFHEPELEEELISIYLRKPVENEVGEFLTATRIMELVGGGIKQPLSNKRIAFAMNRLGFPPHRVFGARGWNVVILSAEEIKNNQRLNAHLG